MRGQLVGQVLRSRSLFMVQDRSWVVTTDYDLLSSYVGCSAESAELLLGDDVLETLP